jgi:hypothetical protein
MATTQQSFFKLANSSLKFGMYLLFKLPAAFFSGIKIRAINEERCVTSVSYKWLTQNPFRSVYFASLAMAAEMSTGTLALSNIYKRVPAISMLVTKMEAVYFKKATGTVFFSCEDGQQLSSIIKEAALTGEARTLTAKSTGRDKDGALVAEFWFTWSFKLKRSKP